MLPVAPGDDGSGPAMRLRVISTQGVFLVYDAARPAGEARSAPGFVAYWNDFATETLYVYDRLLLTQVDAAQALLNLERDLDIDAGLLGVQSRILEDGMSEARSQAEDPVEWTPATEAGILAIMGFGPSVPPGSGQRPDDPDSVETIWCPPGNAASLASLSPPPPPRGPHAGESPAVVIALAVEAAGCGAVRRGGGGDDPCGDAACGCNRCCQGNNCCGSPDPCCDASDPCCEDSDRCCNNDNPCCGSSDPCCNANDDCCGDSNRCCNIDNPCCGSSNPCCNANDSCCGNSDRCCNSDNPCCGSNDPCCNASDPCCGDPDRCCNSDNPCCGSSDPCCNPDDPCCGDPDPCCNPDNPCCGFSAEPCCFTSGPCCNIFAGDLCGDFCCLLDQECCSTGFCCDGPCELCISNGTLFGGTIDV
ncbi:MAG: hypothetical protein IIC01_10465, partial [Planctomycetes bacterium]|nr:hypothetical protein [Planctomycetota bacterium]